MKKLVTHSIPLTNNTHNKRYRWYQKMIFSSNTCSPIRRRGKPIFEASMKQIGREHRKWIINMAMGLDGGAVLRLGWPYCYPLALPAVGPFSYLSDYCRGDPPPAEIIIRLLYDDYPIVRGCNTRNKCAVSWQAGSGDRPNKPVECYRVFNAASKHMFVHLSSRSPSTSLEVLCTFDK